jgi:hypothetical protein
VDGGVSITETAVKVKLKLSYAVPGASAEEPSAAGAMSSKAAKTLAY